MKTRVLIAVTLFLCLCFALCGCDSGVNVPISNVALDQLEETYRIYVYGAVLNEGYVEVPLGSTYEAAIRIAGVLPESVLPSYAEIVVDSTFTQISVHYFDGTQVRECENVNGIKVVNRIPCEGISIETINKIADYVEKHGKVANKKELEAVLGDDYLANFYKFFVAEEDYEEAD